VSDEASHTRFSPREVRSIIAGLMLALFLSSLDQTIVATALSAIATDLGGWELMPWVISAYLIATTVSTPIYGRLSDFYGRRPVLLVSISLFVLGAALSALANSMAMLIVTRIIQGLGGGGLRAISLAVVGDILPPRERGRVQGYLSSAFAVANISGPILGGFFVDALSWHWIFWINLPLGVAAFAATWFQLRRLPRPGRPAKIDWLGAVLIVLACTPVLIGITLVQRDGNWFSPGAWGCFALGGIGLVGLILQERAVSQPMLPLHLFRNDIFTTAICITSLASMVMMALVVLVPLYYQLVTGLSAQQSGARMIALTLGNVLGSYLAGQALTRTGRYRFLPLLGTSTAVIMCLLLAWLGLGRSVMQDAVVTLVLGLGFGCQFSPITATIQNAVDPREGGIAVASMMFFRLMAGAFGVALLSGLLLGQLPSDRHADPEAAWAAFRLVFLAAAGIAGLCLLAALRLREIPLRGR